MSGLNPVGFIGILKSNTSSFDLDRNAHIVRGYVVQSVNMTFDHEIEHVLNAPNHQLLIISSR